MQKQGVIIETNKEYHEYKDAISKSQLAKMSVCPQYFKWCIDTPQEKTEALTVGSAFHKLVLEPQMFGTEFVVCPPIDRRTKAGKEAYSEFEKTVGDREILTQEQFELVRQMAMAVLGNETTADLTDGFVEQSMYGVDELTGVRIKTRPDCYKLVDDRLIIVDFKSCQSAISECFMRDCIKLSYDLQAYMYCYNANRIFNIPMEKIDFIFVAVEKKPPFLLKTFKVNADVLARGERLYRKYIGMYKQACDTNNWWGLMGEHNIIDELTLPAYLLGDRNDD